ncbi:hypothetical protein CDV31_004868 [Fusarium ambrosium]|uniref:Uncharacterized protein n=1 Tax=Fusarium ambrosium TaxID=131363 RepID=A0A428UN78_9HYPO|nr:hypothetical protein CDV31_004868 [Fusarium ambrosium]
MSNIPRVGTESSGFQNQRQTSYAARLNKLSETPLQPELYSRVQYQCLARFLSTAPVCSSQQTPDSDSTDSQRRRVRQRNYGFIHVVVHTFSADQQQPPQRHDFDLDGLARFEDHPQPDGGADQVVFVRGSLSTAWIEALGTKYKIDPEFFRRHLRYLPGRDYSDLPSLPSANTEMMTLVLPSLYTRSHSLAPGQIRKCRGEDADVARRNQNSISGSMACGETVIRRFSTLSDRLFSIEQDISIFKRNRRSGGQTVVVLLDNGLEMNQKDGPPCFSRQDSLMQGAATTRVSPIPVIVPRPPTLLITVDHPKVPRHHDPSSATSICHVASLLPFYFGMSTLATSTTTAAPPNVFALICEVFRLVAASECQFLNRLRSLVQDQELDPADGESMSLVIDTLRYIKVLSEQHRQCLKQNVAFLETHCSADLDARTSAANLDARSPSYLDVRSPSVAGSSTHTQRTQPPPPPPDELTSILVDFKELLARAESLSAFCSETVGLILNGAMLRESQKAIQKADDQRRLTVLAYLFLPLSLVFSFFGMNVIELGTGSRGIWLPFVVLAPSLG